MLCAMYSSRAFCVNRCQSLGPAVRCLLNGTSFMQVSYEAGDHIGLLAENQPEIVERAAAALGLPLSLVFSLNLPNNNPHQLVAPFQCKPTLVLLFFLSLSIAYTLWTIHESNA